MTPARSEHHTKAFLMLVIANLFWGLSFPLIKSLLLIEGRLFPGAGWYATLYVIAPRFVIATLVLVVVQRRGIFDVTRPELVQGLAIAGFASLGMLFQNDGLAYTAASTSAFLTQFYAIMIPIWLSLRHRHNPGIVVWLSSVLVLAGVAILGHFNWQELSLGRGEWETLLGSAFFMGQILWLDDRRFAGNRAEKITLVMFASEMVVFCVLAGFVTPSARALVEPWKSPAWVGFTVALALLATVGSFSIMNRWQPVLSATEAGLAYCIEPIFSAFLALFLPAIFSVWAYIDYRNEHATWTLFLGGGLITAANLLIQLRPQAKSGCLRASGPAAAQPPGR